MQLEQWDLNLHFFHVFLHCISEPIPGTITDYLTKCVHMFMGFCTVQYVHVWGYPQQEVCTDPVGGLKLLKDNKKSLYTVALSP